VEAVTLYWHKSSRSGTQGDCVEVATDRPGVVYVRDSKDPAGAVLAFRQPAWRAFVAGVHRGELDA
jgi:hypothetical protein